METPAVWQSVVDSSRVNMLVAVLEKRIGYHVGGQDIFLNVGGRAFPWMDPAADLAICAAIVSSLRNKAVDPHTVLCGEVGLTGEIRSISHFNLRASEAKNLGFRRIVAPPNAKYDGKGVEIFPLRKRKKALSFLNPGKGKASQADKQNAEDNTESEK